MKMSSRPRWATTICILLAATLNFEFAGTVLAARLAPAISAVPAAFAAPMKPNLRMAPSIPLSVIGGVAVTDLVYKIVGTNVPVQNVKYRGAPQAAGTFSGGQSIFGISDGVILSTGSAAGVVGPNGDNYTDNVSVDNGMPGDTDLDGLLAGESAQTHDAAVLEFDFKPSTDHITFQYLLASEEYTEYLNYHDVIGLFVNNVNQAWIPGTNTPVSVGTINPNINSQYYHDNTVIDQTYGAPYYTTMDGFTSVFTAESPVRPGDWNHVKIAIADFGDSGWDSNLFIKADSFVSRPAQPGVLSIAGVDIDQSITPARANIHIDRSSGTDGTVSVHWSLLDTTSVSSATYVNQGDVQFLPGETAKTVSVEIPANVLSASVSLTAPTNGATLDSLRSTSNILLSSGPLTILLKPDPAGSSALSGTKLVVVQSGKSPIYGTADENNRVVLNNMPSGTWDVSVVLPTNGLDFPKAVQTAKLTVTLGPGEAKTAELPVLGLVKNGETQFTIANMIVFANQGGKDVNNDGKIDQKDIKWLLDLLPPMFVTPPPHVID